MPWPLLHLASGKPNKTIIEIRLTKDNNRHLNASRKIQEQYPASESEILRQQRKVRPVSPHLTIYQPQITMVLSGLHRVTGVAVGGGKNILYRYI